MSLPSIFDYLPAHADSILKLAERQEQKPIRLTPEVLGAAFKAALLTSLGVGAGYAGGRLLGHGIDAASRHYFGTPVPTQYVAPALAVLGGGLATAKVLHDQKMKEVLRRAYEGSQVRSG